MAAVSPSPNSAQPPVPPASSLQSSPPPAPPPTSSPPPASPPSPPASPPQAFPPPASPPLASPPPSTPPPASPLLASPPPASPPPSPPAPASPPPSAPPPASPPPSSPAPAPPLPSTPPAASPPSPQQTAISPATSPPAPSPQSPPTNVTSPPSVNPPPSSTLSPPPEPAVPPPSSSSPSPQSPPRSPTSVPPPPSPVPPSTSSPPPSTNPPIGSSPSPSVNPPTSSPPPPPLSPKRALPPPLNQPKSPPPPASSVTNPPQNSPPPPSSVPPNKSPPPPASPATKLSTPPSTSPVVSPPSKIPPSFRPPPIFLSTPPPPGASPSLPSFPLPSGEPSNNSRSTNSSDTSSSNGGRGIGTGGTIAVGLIFGLLLIGSVGLAAWCLWKQKKRVSGPNNGYVLPTSVGSSPQPDSALLMFGSSATDTRTTSGKDFADLPAEPGGLGNSRSWFTFEELVQATDGFAAQNLLGEGGFGSVYRGRLPDGREVAVKQLNIGGGQGEREFKAEVEIISRINHRNLVSLVGYCISESRRMLVYDYVPNNNLYFHLHGEGRPVMDWAMRMKVAIGAARGIAYLHEDCIPRIIHRDIKSSNILLDGNFEARVSDFGLAKLFQLANTHVTTRVMGTFGYMAPEYAASGKLTEKSDVFSYGVVLLELITGRKPVDTSQPLGDESLVEWARPLLSHALETQEFEQLVDPRLERNYVDAEMFRLIEVAAACVRHSSAKRPRMGQVVRAFDSMSTWDITNGMRVGESEIFNSAEQSEEIRFFQRLGFGNQAYSTDFFTGSGFTSRLETQGNTSDM